MENNSQERKIALFEEIEFTNRLLRHGLRILYESQYDYNYHQVPLFLLSNGFERLIKCILVLIYSDDDLNLLTEPFPFKGREGHNLVSLLQRLTDGLITRNYHKKFPAAKTDIDFLTNNKHLREIIQIFSNFGQGARYHNIDILLSQVRKYSSTSDAWNRLENSLVNFTELCKEGIEPENVVKAINELAYKLVIIIERFVRALCRLLTLGDLGKLAKSTSVHVNIFLSLSDSDLGKNKYQEIY